VLIIIGWAAHRLAGVVDDKIQALAAFHQVPAERFHARRVAQIEAENFQTMTPLLEIRLARITRRRVAGEARGDDQARARAQELDAGLVSDLHTTAGQQCDAPAQVR
jgi:hypothetical protein